MKLLPGETRGAHLWEVDRASIKRKERGELPWFVEVNGGTWGIFRQVEDAITFLYQASGGRVPRKDIREAIQEDYDGA